MVEAEWSAEWSTGTKSRNTTAILDASDLIQHNEQFQASVSD